jgi:hypothetical protein
VFCFFELSNDVDDILLITAVWSSVGFVSHVSSSPRGSTWIE